MMSEEVWVNCFEEDLQDAEMNDDDLSQVARYFKSALDELIPDQQGRVVINPMLKAHAKFDKGAEVILIPMAQHIEIWAKQVASSEFTSMDAKTLKNIMATRGIGGRKRELSV
jgi:DNA-binding transcriptional regulator/RsmH inhibitor MraZ